MSKLSALFASRNLASSINRVLEISRHRREAEGSRFLFFHDRNDLDYGLVGTVAVMDRARGDKAVRASIP